MKGTAEFREKQAESGDAESLVRLTPRDKELLAHVATARYLTLQQLKRLVFVRRVAGGPQHGATGGSGPSEIVCKRRLTRLGSGATQYLRRLQYRDDEGAATPVFAAEPHGHAIARQVLRRPPAAPAQDVKAQFLEHTVMLNDLSLRRPLRGRSIERAARDFARLPSMRSGGKLPERTLSALSV